MVNIKRPNIIVSPVIASQQGISLIEVLITIVILAVGLLGLAGLQLRLQASEVEAYQRTHALMLVEDMTNRISANRNNVSAYVTTVTGPVGTGDDQPAICAGNVEEYDLCQWSNALKGVAEQSGVNNIGAMIGARGCVEDLGTGEEFLITVAWQGLTPTVAPASSCGENLYDGGDDTNCVNDLCRRVMSTIIRIGNLSS